MAIGNYGDVPFKRAVGRDSFSGKEIVYRFTDPDFDFGRVVVRANQPNSIVRRDLFVGFSGDALTVGTGSSGSSGSSVQIEEVEFWLKIQGKLRPGRSYEWEIQVTASNEIIDNGFPAIIPVFWADGEPVGVEVTVRNPIPEDTDRIQRGLVPHGVVSLKEFDRQTGGAWIVLKPQGYGARFGVRRFSFREVDTAEALAAKTDMPIPVRYIPMRNVLENSIAEALERGSRALTAAQNTEHFWGGTTSEDSVRITSMVVAALMEVDPEADTLAPAMQWLSDQEPPEGQPWGVDTVSARLYCLARHGGLDSFRRTIHADVRTLANAQSQEDGGWSAQVRGNQADRPAGVNSDNAASTAALSSLREARFAGAEIDQRVWRRIMQYWTAAQAYDGGFRERLERYGGVGRATTSGYTALGAGALIASLDLAAGFGGRRCTTFLRSRQQLRAIEQALDWLDNGYKETFREFGSLFLAIPDPYFEPGALQFLGEVSGLSHFNEKDHFTESAQELLRHYDLETGMFGVRGQEDSWAESPSVLRTARALSILGAGAAPTILQRIIAGADEKGWSEYKGDVAHLVRYIASRRGRPFNWRRSTIDQEVRELAKVPMLLLSVVGPFEWSEESWNKIREYCFSGGTVVVDIAEGQDAQREVVVSALRRMFPAYELSGLPADSPAFSGATGLSEQPPLRVMGNGFRYFLFLPGESWSCQWHLNHVDDHEASFRFMDDLLTYATDGTPPRSSFTPSTYAVGSIPAHFLKAAHLEVGGQTPAYPNLIDTMDRLMQANFRLSVTSPDDPAEADLLWVSVTGDKRPSEEAKARVLDALGGGRFLFVDVVSGREDWDETFRGILRGMEGVTLTKLRRTESIYTGEIPGTQGFDVVQVNLRKALQTRFSTSGRCDLYGIRFNGAPVGVYSAYDISSGIGYNYYPDCRGAMPKHARELAMNAFLMAYERKVSRRSMQ